MSQLMTCAICTSETIQAKDGLCRPCRLRSWCVVRYPWSEEMDAQLTRLYRGAKGKMHLSRGMTEFAQRYRMPKYIVQNRAQALHLRIRANDRWSPEQVAYIEENAGTFSLARMAQRLGRTELAVKHKLFSLGIGCLVIEGYTHNELARRFGVQHSKIARWLSRGWLWEDYGRIPHESVAKFVWEHMDEYRFAAADEWWLKVTLNPRLGSLSVVNDRKAAA